MPMPLKLEVFERPEAPDSPALMMPAEIEDLRLSAYERGYVAGWEDAGRQADAERAERAARVAARIEALTFGYHEARAHVLNGLAGLIEALVAQLLPALAQQSVVPLVVEQVLLLATEAADRPLKLRVPPGWRADYAAALEGLALPPLTLTEDPRLDETQAEILPEDDAGATLVRIDLTEALARIAAALAPFRPRPTEERKRA